MPETKPKVLIADDDPHLRRLIKEALSGDKFEVWEACDGNETWNLIQSLHPDIVLLDIMMPGIGGFEICRYMRENPFTRNIPVVMLTAKSQVSDKIEGMESGADDYITKPFDPLELEARIEMHIRRYLRESDMSPVCGLPGTKAIEKTLSSRISREEKFALCYIDLDDFKAFTDYYGFVKGSELIRTTGTILKKAVTTKGGEDDFVAHIGGDDFIIITIPERAVNIAKEIIKLFDEIAPSFYEKEDLERGFIVTKDRTGFVAEFP
ncbi:MAG: response regulator, partial [Actinomycetota bacterium]|nr:response regulator [Actinomycetota bacterium]